VTVDLDLEERREEIDTKPRRLSELELLMYLLRLQYVCRSTQCKICRTRKGLHVYIKTNRYDFEKVVGLRLWLGDDPIRVDIDILRIRRGVTMYIETLFQAKVAHGKVSKEVCVDAKQFFRNLVKHL